MAIANHINRSGLVKLFAGDITWDSGGSTVKLQLMEDSYVPGTATFRDVHDYLNDVSAYNPTSALSMALTLQAPQTAAGKVYLDPSTASVTFTSVGGSETVRVGLRNPEEAEPQVTALEEFHHLLEPLSHPGAALPEVVAGEHQLHGRSPPASPAYCRILSTAAGIISRADRGASRQG